MAKRGVTNDCYRPTVAAQVRRAKVECSSECKSRHGKGRRDREAIPATVEVMKLSEPGKQVAACGRVAGSASMNSLCDPLWAG